MSDSAAQKVCVVREVSKKSGQTFLFGVFTDELTARRVYGEPDGRWFVLFDTVEVRNA